jgi:hypothetical protein
MNQVKQSAVNSDAAGDAGAFGTPFVLIDSRWILRADRSVSSRAIRRTELMIVTLLSLQIWSSLAIFSRMRPSSDVRVPLAARPIASGAQS